jgi:hypothetical protein
MYKAVVTGITGQDGPYLAERPFPHHQTANNIDERCRNGRAPQNDCNHPGTDNGRIPNHRKTGAFDGEWGKRP